MELPPELTIGVELEAEEISYNDVKKIIRDMPVRKDILEKWKVKDDCSLNRGTEITSPILTRKQAIYARIGLCL